MTARPFGGVGVGRELADGVNNDEVARRIRLMGFGDRVVGADSPRGQVPVSEPTFG